jgi:hypothetical protein
LRPPARQVRKPRLRTGCADFRHPALRPVSSRWHSTNPGQKGCTVAPRTPREPRFGAPRTPRHQIVPKRSDRTRAYQKPSGFQRNTPNSEGAGGGDFENQNLGNPPARRRSNANGRKIAENFPRRPLAPRGRRTIAKLPPPGQKQTLTHRHLAANLLVGHVYARVISPHGSLQLGGINFLALCPVCAEI